MIPILKEKEETFYRIGVQIVLVRLQRNVQSFTNISTIHHIIFTVEEEY
jgi:hypothetical protein